MNLDKRKLVLFKILDIPLSLPISYLSSKYYECLLLSSSRIIIHL